MKYLFLHSSFPAQFSHMATFLAQQTGNQVVFVTSREDGSIPGVNKLVYKLHREVGPQTHKYLRSFEKSVLHGQGAYRSLLTLKEQGFKPDVIYGHSGWGPTLFMKDLFPDVPLVCYFEWFYHAHGTDAEFGPDETLSLDDECRIRIKNAPILTDLYSCDIGISPTFWQHSQFPNEFAAKIRVIHDGINTDFFQPGSGAKLILPEKNMDLSDVPEIVTYVTRGMEPYRGFPQVMKAVETLLKKRPRCHVVIVGSDTVVYGAPTPDGKSYKQLMLEQLDLDLTRVHFTGHLSYPDYRKVLQASSVHIYLTRPFVLSWSFLEAMSCGCSIVASATPPVQEVVQDGINGRLVDFFSPDHLAETVLELLDDHQQRKAIGYRARETILERYDLQHLLPRQILLLNELASKKRNATRMLR